MNPRPFWFLSLVIAALALAPMPAHSQGVPGDQIPVAFKYVTCPQTNNLNKIDPSTNTTVATIPVGASPRGATVTPNRTRVYVANGGDNTVSVVDASTDMVTATIPVGTEPNGVASGPNGSRVYVANSGSSTVSVIDTATNSVVAWVTLPGAKPFKLAANPNESDVWVVSPPNNTIYRLSTATNMVVGTLTVPTPVDVTFNPGGTRAAVSSPEVGVTIYDTSTNNPVGSVAIPGASEGAYSPDGTLFDATSALGNVSSVDPQTNMVVMTADLGGAPRGISFSADGSMFYVGVENPAGHGIDIFDTATTTQTGFIPKNSPPLQIAGFWSWVCGDYSNLTPGSGSWTPGQVITIGFDIRIGGCPPTASLSDGSTWVFVGGCTTC